MTDFNELFELSSRLENVMPLLEDEQVLGPLDAIEDAVKTVEPSFSGSWQGYHANVYYEDFQRPPPGAHFSQEWGLMDAYSDQASRGSWIECDPDEVRSYILKNAGNPDLGAAVKASEIANDEFDQVKPELISILQNELEDSNDPFLEGLLEELKKLEKKFTADVADHFSPKGQILTRDAVVLGQGTIIPPHMMLLSKTRAVRHSFGICKASSDIASKAASHIERKGKKNKAFERVGTNVFIGHGQSTLWRDLKDFVQDRLKLPWDEFNRVPVAGITNIARLSEMLDSAAIAFLVLTAEDEMKDGSHQARMNVVHEAGLFQGRLGFTKAIVLLEEGCEEFSNIEGLGQIRFPEGELSAKFEEIRRVLERENLIDA